MNIADTANKIRAEKIRNGERRALARAITLVESTLEADRAAAAALLAELGTARQSLRVGLSGTPGVGKSTFIESFGKMLTGQGLRVAVLAVDPSSTRSGGSILGDKTRMDLLARDPLAFIRPSPSQTQLGGVARRTREAIALCEAAGFDIILIETVGVGQSETAVAEMSDLFLLLLAPAGGDELQGVKRGIMETCDMILVNKADGDLKLQAGRTCADYSGALHLMRKRPHDPPRDIGDFPKAVTVSALENNGLQSVWEDMQTLAEWRKSSGIWDERRADQARFWFHEEVRATLLARLTANDAVKSRLKLLEHDVAQGKIRPAQAAQTLIAQLFPTKG